MCGLHAKHPGHIGKADGLYQKVQHVLRTVEEQQRPVLCHVPQLSKGIEFLKTLNVWNIHNIPVYIDKSVMDVVVKMEQLSMPILNVNNRMMGNDIPAQPHIFVTANAQHTGKGCCQEMQVDFSLHEDFQDMKAFIKKINPRKAIIVHCAKEYSLSENTIERIMMLDGECRTQFLFAEEGELYQL